MPRFPRALTISVIACALPGAIIALAATLGAWWWWGGLNFSHPLYYVTLALAAWCPVSKILVWRLWRPEVHVCPTCIPTRAIERRLSPSVEE